MNNKTLLKLTTRELFNKWTDISEEMDSIDYDEIQGKQPEFGEDEQITRDFVEFQLDELRELEQDLELLAFYIEEELKERGFKVVNELSKTSDKGFEWVYKLQSI